MSVKLYKRRFPSGVVHLYLDISANGTRTKEALGLSLVGDRLQNRETLKFAEEIRAKRELQLIEQRHGVLQSSKRRESFVVFVRNLIDAKQSRNTRQSWKNALEHFVSFAGEETAFGALNGDLFEKFKAYLLKEVSPNSAQIYFSRIKTALYQAMKDGMIAANPAQFITVKKEEKLPLYLTIEQVQKLALTSCPNVHVKAAFLFSCFTGLRYSDLCALTWKQIRDGSITITQKKTKIPLVVPLSEQAVRILEQIKKLKRSPRITREQPEDLVFVLPRQSTSDKELKKWATSAGLGFPLSMHKGRHTFATLAHASGVDLYTVSKLLGHKNLKTTQIYAQVIDAKRKEAVSRLPTLELAEKPRKGD